MSKDRQDAGFLPRFADCVACVDCRHRKMYTSKVNGKETGYRKASCAKYSTKPTDVAFDAAPCPKYEKQQ